MPKTKKCVSKEIQVSGIAAHSSRIQFAGREGVEAFLINEVDQWLPEFLQMIRKKTGGAQRPKYYRIILQAQIEE